MLTMQCLQAGFDWGGVSRCDPYGNSWCCQGHRNGAEDCCKTNRTTSLNPYPFLATDIVIPSGTATTSASSIAASTSSYSISTTISSKALTSRFDTSNSSSSTRQMPMSGADPSTSSASTTQTGQSSVETSRNDNDINNRVVTNDNRLSASDLIAIGIGVPVGVATIVSSILLFINFNRKRNRRNAMANGSTFRNRGRRRF